MANKLKVLYFIATERPTNYDRQRASKLSVAAAVSFRNIKYVKSDSPAEVCDAVTGDFIPAQYTARPRIEEVLAAKNDDQPAVPASPATPVPAAVPAAPVVAETK